ncbi:MAG: TonB-dependent receptor, partial [Candidatus Eisenbacteria sp.]|nr:TonB-dependent receptor [Candidatus Eisenbacteria bacterium]
ASPDSHSPAFNPEFVEAGSWNGSLTVVSRGWERNHFLEAYRHNPEHAPYEETALFKCRADFARRLGESSWGKAWIDYDRYLTWTGDGTYRQDLDRYGHHPEGGNGEADDTGLYWAPDSKDGNSLAHVFDYFARKYTSTISGGLDFHRAWGKRFLYGLRGEASHHTCRRHEHFSPTDAWAVCDAVGYGRTLHLGYDPSGYNVSDDPYGPGTSITGRLGMWANGSLGRSTRVDLGVGGHWFACSESALVSLENPRGDDGFLDPNELHEPDAHINPECSLGLRRHMGRHWDAWGLGYRAAYAPPLEALSSPVALLSMPTPAGKPPEGVMGNPNLSPEIETGVQVGITKPFAVGGHLYRLKAAAYGARLSNAIRMTYTSIGTGGASSSPGLPTYENGGEMRRWGLHLEASTGDQEGRLWVRMAYDLSRIESDFFEPPLLDNRWLYPNRPQGEYETEGYAGPLGGILDGATGLAQSGGAGTLSNADFRPANVDRTHQLSLAIIARGSPPPARANWFSALTGGWIKGLILRFESGRPYTQTYVHPAGLLPQSDEESRGEDDPVWETVLAEAQRNALRMPPSFTLDLALIRHVQLGWRDLQISLEILNLLGWNNTCAVYRATGETDDDGCLDKPGCAASIPEEIDREMYRQRLEDPRHYARPFEFRAGVGLEVF